MAPQGYAAIELVSEPPGSPFVLVDELTVKSMIRRGEFIGDKEGRMSGSYCAKFREPLAVCGV